MQWLISRNGRNFSTEFIRAEWNKKMKNYEEKGYSDKEVLNIQTEEPNLAELEF